MKLSRTSALLAAAALGLGGLVATAPTAQAQPAAVSGVQFRWGFNDESNNRGAAPGSFNLFSAGKIGNPGAGGKTLSNATQGATWSNGAAAGWSPASCNVRIEKRAANGTDHGLATWAGTKTDKDGNALAGYAVATKFSDHQVVIDNGAGTVDQATDSASITWDGDFTVVYYSGMSFFYVSDPTLNLSGGDGTLTAKVSGYGSDMDDQSKWVALPERVVTLATLADVEVGADGLVTTPAYRGVEYTAPAGTPNPSVQVRTGADWGSFPAGFVDFQQAVGSAAYWHSSGGAVDKNKPAAPLTVDLTPAAAAPVAPVVTVAVPTTAYGRAATVTVKVGTTGCPATSGSLALSGAGTQTKTVANGAATFVLPRTLAPRTYTLTAAYGGNARFAARTVTKAFTVTRAGVVRPVLKVVKKPTSKKAGRATVAVRSAVAGVPVTGKVTVTLRKGGAKKVVAATVRNGVATATLPKLAKGSWKVTAVYAGSATHAPGTSATVTVAAR